MFKLPHNYAHVPCQQGQAQNSSSQASTVHEPLLPDVQAEFRKGRRTRDQIANIHQMIQLACWCRRHKRCEFDPWVGKIPRRRPRHPTAVFLPGEAHEQRALEGHSPQGRAELDVTDVTTHTLHRRKSKGAPENISHCFIDCTEALPLDHNRLREILKELGLSDHFT